jgi:hypothetical protein
MNESDHGSLVDAVGGIRMLQGAGNGAVIGDE